MSDTTNRELLVRSRWFLLVVALLGILVLSLSYWLVDPALPDFGREVKLFLAAFSVGSLFAAPWATRIVDWLHTPDTRWLLTTDAEQNKLELWEIPAPLWRDLDVEDDLHRWDSSQPVYEVREYDEEDNHAVGTWRGSATDLELVEHRESVREVRGDLEDLAREGLAIRAKQSSIVRGAVADIVMEFVTDFEAETTYSGEEIQQRVDAALDDLDAPVDDQDDDQDDHPDDPLVESLTTNPAPDDSDKNGNQ
jgi:hypothetical protein